MNLSDVGAGRALVSTCSVKIPGEVMLVIPPRALLNPVQMSRGRRVAWTPRRVADHQPNHAPLSTHQILACVLAQWRAQKQPVTSRMVAFFESLPTEFDTMPLVWVLEGRQSLLEALPPSAAHRLARVQSRFEADWRRVSTLDSDTLASIWASVSDAPPARITQSDFAWGWLCTNSRCVYMDLHYARHEDNFTLAPLLDMANHTAYAARECRVRFSSVTGMELCAPAEPLAEGDDVCITYGPHDNATLLTEYGFILSPDVCADDTEAQACGWLGNPHASVWLDDAVERLFETDAAGSWKRTFLQCEGYWAYVKRKLTQRLLNACAPGTCAPIVPPTYGSAPFVYGRGRSPRT